MGITGDSPGVSRKEAMANKVVRIICPVAGTAIS